VSSFGVNMKKTTLVKRWLEDPEKDVNQQEREFIQQSELTARKLLYWLATRAIFVIIAVLVAVGLIRWNNRDESQINVVFHESFQVARLALIDRERFEDIEAWLRTLVISGESHGALKAARTIVDADLRSRAMVNIVEALAKAGKTDEALRAANEAFEAARKIVDVYFRSQAMVNIVVALAKAGKTDEAFEAARKIGNASLRSRAMAGVGGALARAGKTDEALRAANEAIEAARKIESAYSRSMHMVDIVEALAKAGKTDEAFEAARTIADADYSSQAMVNIVEALAKAGKTDEAFEAARKIMDADYRSWAMASVAEAMIKNREAAKAESALNEAQRAAQQATKASERSTRIAAVAIGLAKLHHYRLARETADLCTSPGNKLAAYTAILREYLIKRNPNLEKLFEEDL
jgi:tetratricopeptide (TPR) repeat protein